MATYRAHVLNTQAAGDGSVHFDCWIQLLTDVGPPEVWTNVPRGHRTVRLQASSILTITQSGMTDPQKRTAIRELFRAEALSWGIDESDEANNDILTLIPGGSWPVDVEL
jgi:hypothetical protein